MTIIIITLFKSLIVVTENECSTNWGDCKSNKSNKSNKIKSINQINQIKLIKCWFLRRGENRSTRRETSRSRVENQQTQSKYDAGSANRTLSPLRQPCSPKAVSFKLGSSDLYHKRNKMTPTTFLPWQHS